MSDAFDIPRPQQEPRRCLNESCRKLMANSNKGEYCFLCQDRIRIAAVREDADTWEPVPRVSAFKHATGQGPCPRCGKPRHRDLCAGMRPPRPPQHRAPVKLPPPRLGPRLPEAVPATEIEMLPEEQTGDGQIERQKDSEPAGPAVQPRIHAGTEPEETPEMKTEASTPAPAPAAKKRHAGFDSLRSEAIAWSAVPAEAAPVPKRSGRLGELWKKLLGHDAEGKGMAEKVQNRSLVHAGQTLRHMASKAKGIGRELEHRRDADRTTVYMRLKPVGPRP